MERRVEVDGWRRAGVARPVRQERSGKCDREVEQQQQQRNRVEECLFCFSKSVDGAHDTSGQGTGKGVERGSD